jgi:hypothetical protein
MTIWATTAVLAGTRRWRSKRRSQGEDIPQTLREDESTRARLIALCGGEPDTEP